MIFVYLKRAKLSKMRLITLIFSVSFRKFSYMTCSFIIAGLLLSSCASNKNATYTYLDDIYNPGYSVPVFNDYEEPGEPPTNVPGRAYVYQPIPQPSVSPNPAGVPTYSQGTLPTNDIFLLGDAYNASNPANMNVGHPWMNGVYGAFSLGLGPNSYPTYYNPYFGYANPYYGYGGYNPYFGYTNFYNTGSICPSAQGSSSSFITKRFDWNNSAEDNINYLANYGKSVADNSDSNVRQRSAKKGRFFSTGGSGSDSGSNGSVFGPSRSNSFSQPSRSSNSSRNSTINNSNTRSSSFSRGSTRSGSSGSR